tara:strand:- start:10953 stop:12905 length:1953 start_codon:yes stop_codon:yes gene_type:complete
MFGLRFQTKLLFAMISTALISFVAIVIVTELHLTRMETEKFSASFEEQVASIQQSREERALSVSAFAKRLAESEMVRQSLSEENQTKLPDQKQMMEVFAAARQDSDPANPGNANRKPGGPPGGREPGIMGSMPSIAIMDREGKISVLTSPPGTGRNRSIRRKFSKSTPAVQRMFAALEADPNMQLFGYLPAEFLREVPSSEGAKNNRGGPEAAAQEVVVAPVFASHESTKLIGGLVVGINATTMAERFLAGAASAGGDEARINTAIYLEGDIYGREMPEAFQTDLITALDAEILASLQSGDPSAAVCDVLVTLDGEPHQVHYSLLNPGSALPPAWQVATFPMTGLTEQLWEIRKNGAIIGTLTIVLGTIWGLILSRSLSRPIRELSSGTQAVREGRFDTRLVVHSGDELGQLTESFNTMTEGLAQREQYRELLGKVSDETVAQAMIEGTLNPELGGELKRVSILFCDIRGFTTMTEHMPPDQVIDMLNDHMTAMTEIVREHFGMVDKFVGDEVMAVFGGIKSYGNDAVNAARCAIAMMQCRQRLNQQLAHPFEIGIGIATGEVVAGCMGASDRLNYTVLGARVNLAARLSGVAQAAQIVIDDATLSALPPGSKIVSLEPSALKGFTAAVSPHLLEKIAEEGELEMVGATG